MTCEHTSLNFESSRHAETAGYRRPTAQQRAAATVSVTRRNKKDASNNDDTSTSTFPAPLVLPDDDLSIDPRYPPQSLRSWLREKDRNEVTTAKNVIYVAAPPNVGTDVQFMRSWSQPQKESKLASVAQPRLEDVIDYLSAFYHGLPVKPMPSQKLCFASWDTKRSKSKAKIPSYIGLNTPTECIGIRTRPSSDGVFAAQLNLNDLLDAAISMLPKDAYAHLLLVEHDLFEDDDDVFVCGRAYGGSRVAVISTARYHPYLDRTAKVEREHAWPASHCASYMQACSDQSSARPKKKAKLQHNVPLPTSSPPDETTISPIQAALSAHKALPAPDSSSALYGLWLGRVCRTASHELGHCFGIDHCVYYACAMQGSSCLIEDARQPPYLCPVDLAKMLQASGTTAEARYRALLAFCERHPGVHLFAAFGAWIRACLAGDSPQLTS